LFKSAAAQLVPEALVGQRAMDGIGESIDVARVDQQRGVADHFGQRGKVRGYQRRAARHRFERRQAEAFVELVPIASPGPFAKRQ
jgi:hypothetical protein